MLYFCAFIYYKKISCHLLFSSNTFCAVFYVCVFLDTEILAGNVIFIDNFLLCYVNSIVWEDIFIGRSAEVWFEYAPSPFRVPCESYCSETSWTILMFVFRSKIWCQQYYLKLKKCIVNRYCERKHILQWSFIVTVNFLLI